MSGPILSSYEDDQQSAVPLPMWRRKPVLGLLLRVIVSGGGLLVVVTSVDVQVAAQSVLSIDPLLFLVAFFVYQLGNVVRSMRWQILLDSAGAHLPLLRVLHYNYVGSFFNLLLPTAIGGDAIRILKARGRTGTAVSVATVLVDRILGLMALFAIALAVIPFTIATADRTLLVIGALASAAGLAAGVLLLDNRWLQRGIAHTLLGRLPGIAKAKAMCQAIEQISRNKASLTRATLISFGFNILLIGVYYLTAHALRLRLPFDAVVLLVPIISVLALVPSIQGLGVRESAIIVLTAPYAVSGPDALALGVAVYLIMLLTGLLGLLTYLGVN